MDRQKFVKSQQATRMLRQVQVSEEPYLSEIAGKLDTSYHALKKYADTARELNLIEDGERKGKKQLLQNNWDGYITLYTTLWKDIQQDLVRTDSYDLTDQENKEKLITDYQELKEDKAITNILKTYFKHHLVNNSGQNLEDIIVNDLSTAYMLLSEDIFWPKDIEDYEMIHDSKFIEFMKYEWYKYVFTRGSGAFSMISAIDIEERE